MKAIFVVFAILGFVMIASAGNFQCDEAGWFADQDSCSRFHICMQGRDGLRDISMKCPNGMAFDHGFCSKDAHKRLNCAA